MTSACHERLSDVCQKKIAKIRSAAQETLRLYPPVGAGQVRLVNQAITLHCGLEVPAGAIIWVPHHGLHTSSRNWSNSKDFIPGDGRKRVCLTKEVGKTHCSADDWRIDVRIMVETG